MEIRMWSSRVLLTYFLSYYSVLLYLVSRFFVSSYFLLGHLLLFQGSPLVHCLLLFMSLLSAWEWSTHDINYGLKTAVSGLEIGSLGPGQCSIPSALCLYLLDNSTDTSHRPHCWLQVPRGELAISLHPTPLAGLYLSPSTFQYGTISIFLGQKL